MRWESDTRLVLDDATLILDWGATAAARVVPPGCFILQKTPEMVEFYSGLRESGFKRILEAGISRGGSVVLLHQVLRPAQLVAFDLSPAAQPDLAAYLDRSRASAQVKLRYGLDQSDAVAVRALIHHEFEGQPLDLVIDDASHLLPETRAMLNAAFPSLRPGGLYVIEDWGWAHWPGIWQHDGGPWAGHPALTQLVLELVMTSASRPETIASVLVRRDLVAITRGAGQLPADFDLSRSYLSAGRRFVETNWERRRGFGLPLPPLFQRALWVWKHEGAPGIARCIRKHLTGGGRTGSL